MTVLAEIGRVHKKLAVWKCQMACFIQEWSEFIAQIDSYGCVEVDVLCVFMSVLRYVRPLRSFAGGWCLTYPSRFTGSSPSASSEISLPIGLII